MALLVSVSISQASSLRMPNEHFTDDLADPSTQAYVELRDKVQTVRFKFTRNVQPNIFRQKL